MACFSGFVGYARGFNLSYPGTHWSEFAHNRGDYCELKTVAITTGFYCIIKFLYALIIIR